MKMVYFLINIPSSGVTTKGLEVHVGNIPTLHYTMSSGSTLGVTLCVKYPWIPRMRGGYTPITTLR